MKFELWLAFVAAYSVISLIPGPSVFMVTGQALTRGLRAAMLCVVGDIVGGFFLIALSLFGVGAILAASAELFQIVKWAGVLYMAYLGYQQIKDARSRPATAFSETEKGADFESMKAGFLIGILNPKAIMFYVAFLSQFLDPDGDPVAQLAILVVTSTIVVGVILTGYAVFASKARTAFQSERARKSIGYVGGGFLLGGSVLIATTR